MNALLDNVTAYSVSDFDSPLQISLSPNGRFFAVLTPCTTSIWTALDHPTMVGISIRNKEFYEKTGMNKQLVWDSDGEWLGVLVCSLFFLLFLYAFHISLFFTRRKRGSSINMRLRKNKGSLRLKQT